MDRDGDVDATDKTLALNNAGVAFGRGVLSGDPDTATGNRKGYAGYELATSLDGDAGIYDARNRFLIASLGRWTRRDDLGYVDGMNLYEYARSNPLAGVDSMGFAASCAGGLNCGGYGQEGGGDSPAPSLFDLPNSGGWQEIDCPSCFSVSDGSDFSCLGYLDTTLDWLIDGLGGASITCYDCDPDGVWCKYSAEIIMRLGRKEEVNQSLRRTVQKLIRLVSHCIM